MSVTALIQGMVGLFLLLVVTALLGAVGSVELLVWLGLEVVWVFWWLRSRRRSSTA